MWIDLPVDSPAPSVYLAAATATKKVATQAPVKNEMHKLGVCSAVSSDTEVHHLILPSSAAGQYYSNYLGTKGGEFERDKGGDIRSDIVVKIVTQPKHGDLV
jgi:hypothetical protein